MSAETLISRLEKVKRTGSGTWLARCPAHDDKNPSMSVREMPDERVLVYCHAGCGVAEIVGAVGLNLEDLFPPRCVAGAFAAPVRRPFPAGDVLEALAHECDVLSIVAFDIGKGKVISEEDRQRALLAAERIKEARRLALG